MNVQKLQFLQGTMSPDDTKLYVSRRDISGGSNTRQHASNIAENQVALLYNADLGVAGESTKRRGLTLIQSLGTATGTGLFGFEPNGSNNELLATETTNLKGWVGSATFTTHKADFTTGLPTTMIKAGESGEGDIVLISNGTDNVFRMAQDHTFEDCGDTKNSPPKTTVMTYFRNRVWMLKDDLLYFSDAYPDSYSHHFDRTTNAYRMPVGDERALVGIRDTGLFIIGLDQIWGFNPSITPDPTTDKPEKMLDFGCVSGKTAIQVGDDVYFLGKDGVRGVMRTQQDKLQLGVSYPLSYSLKTEFENISWTNITKACAVYFDNKYLISLPTKENGIDVNHNNQIWCYFPSSQSWSVFTGLTIAAFAKLTIDGEERLYGIDSTSGKVYRVLYGYSDNSVAINYQEEGRKEDLGQPFVKKVGGEVQVKAKAAGNYNLTVSAQFDDGGWQTLGTINLEGNLVVFPLTFPVAFKSPSICTEKFHIDSYGEWYRCQLKVAHNATNGSADITIYERNIVSYPTEYINEEVL